MAADIIRGKRCQVGPSLLSYRVESGYFAKRERRRDPPRRKKCALGRKREGTSIFRRFSTPAPAPPTRCAHTRKKIDSAKTGQTALGSGFPRVRVPETTGGVLWSTPVIFARCTNRKKVRYKVGSTRISRLCVLQESSRDGRYFHNLQRAFWLFSKIQGRHDGGHHQTSPY